MPINTSGNQIIISGPEHEIASIELDEVEGPTNVLDMSLVNSSGMSDIESDTGLSLQIQGFFNGLSAFINPDKPILFNNLDLKTGLNSGLTSVKGALYERRANRINITIDDDIDLTDYSVVNFAMFSLISKRATVLKSLADSVQVTSSTITIDILPEDNLQAGDYVIELAIGDDSLASMFVSKVSVRLTRL